MTLFESLQLLNLLIVPMGIYIVRIERQLSTLTEWQRATEKTLDYLRGNITAAHRRLDLARIPPYVRESDG